MVLTVLYGVILHRLVTCIASDVSGQRLVCEASGRKCVALGVAQRGGVRVKHAIDVTRQSVRSVGVQHRRTLPEKKDMKINEL